MLNALALVAVVALADLVSRGQQQLERRVGPVDVSLTATQLTVAGVALIVASAALLLATSVVRALMTARWTRAMRGEVVDGFLDAAWEWQSTDRAGALQTNLAFVSAGGGVLSALVALAQGLTGVVVMLGTAVILNAAAALGVIVLGVLLFVALRPITFRAGDASWRASLLQKDGAEEVGEISDLAQDIQIAGVTEAFRSRSNSTTDRLVRADRSASILGSMVTPIYQGLALAVVVVALGFATAREGIDVAVLGAVALLVIRSVSYGQQLQSSYNSLATSLPPVHELDKSRQAFADHRKSFGAKDLDRIASVALRDTSYSYGSGEAALRSVSLQLSFGEIVGIVGPSGAGKTTLAQLLLRLRRPTAGAIEVNEIPIDDFDQESFSRQVALVPQAPKLLHGTIRENIAFFREFIDDDAVYQAAIAAGIHDTIVGLPAGYSTEIGRSTRNLSGGQIQRIGIARALAGNPSMIVLDEPTSALDQDAEQVVQDALARIRGHALVVVIAHRLTTLSICDRVVVLEHGRIEAQGEMQDARAASPFLEAALRKLAMSANLDAAPSGIDLLPEPRAEGWSA